MLTDEDTNMSLDLNTTANTTAFTLFKMTAPAYTPMPSLGQELGIMFAFFASMVLTALIYALIWRLVQRRKEAEEKLRREKLNAVLRAREAERMEKHRSEAVDPSVRRMRRPESPFSASLLNTPDDEVHMDLPGSCNTGNFHYGPRSTDELGARATEAQEHLII